MIIFIILLIAVSFYAIQSDRGFKEESAILKDSIQYYKQNYKKILVINDSILSRKVIVNQESKEIEKELKQAKNETINVNDDVLSFSDESLDSIIYTYRHTERKQD